jgi:hypothetical protein
MDRRVATRTILNCSVRMATAAEQPMPAADGVDASDHGVLIALAEPVGIVRGTRACISMPTSDGLLHLLGTVQRVERGDDFRTYVALHLLDDLNRYELDRWQDWLSEHRSADSDRQ